MYYNIHLPPFQLGLTPVATTKGQPPGRGRGSSDAARPIIAPPRPKVSPQP